MQRRAARLAGHMAGLFCKFAIEQQQRRQEIEARLAEIEADLKAARSKASKPKLRVVAKDVPA